MGADEFEKLFHAVAAQSRGRENFGLREHLGHGFQQGQHARLVVEQVDLVHHHDDRAFLFGKRLDERGKVALHEVGLAQIQVAVDDEHPMPVCGERRADAGGKRGLSCSALTGRHQNYL